jgi:hypothetical protein
VDGARRFGGTHGHAIIGAALAYDVLMRTHRTGTLLNYRWTSTPPHRRQQRKRKWNLSDWELQHAAEKGVVWAERETCSKWRLLPASIKSWPGNFDCSMDPNTACSSCDVEEEVGGRQSVVMTQPQTNERKLKSWACK